MKTFYSNNHQTPRVYGISDHVIEGTEKFLDQLKSLKVDEGWHFEVSRPIPSNHSENLYVVVEASAKKDEVVAIVMVAEVAPDGFSFEQEYRSLLEMPDVYFNRGFTRPFTSYPFDKYAVSTRAKALKVLKEDHRANFLHELVEDTEKTLMARNMELEEREHLSNLRDVSKNVLLGTKSFDEFVRSTTVDVEYPPENEIRPLSFGKERR